LFGRELISWLIAIVFRAKIRFISILYCSP